MLGSVIASRFEITEVAGQGAMGQVFRARDRAGGPDVALKVMHAHVTDRVALERFEREARVVASLRHPGIIRGRARRHG